MLIVFVRTFIIYAVVVVLMRLMGKRQIGQLEPYELVVAVMIAELAAIPMEDKAIPLVHGLIPIFTLFFIQVCISYINMKSLWFRSFMDGSPSIVIRNGKIDIDELAKARYNINELLEQLRTKGYANIADVEFAILETSGNLSVIPKSQKRPLTPADLHIDTGYEGLPLPLVLDGTIQRDNLSDAGLTVDWLVSELAKLGIDDVNEVFFASLDTQGNLFYQTRKER
ncbi:MAG: DUF421 domain-containing protein [Limnochordia bacterium]|nr:DUF421 domain-containing protein [Bacillota bacterium]HOB07945.1 DUF421 domain-containing protein [Limnochordia bacterium]NLH31551.1 DUF421 domain-containing protein [Bacillota bacterium]HPT92111.1 DUF421 domain-containing protein [Limnochordia bacterium]HPZ29902.1 DUF421 domain-containing protein [Limnochordia bacterium]